MKVKRTMECQRNRSDPHRILEIVSKVTIIIRVTSCGLVKVKY